jgi:hypothetical protein
MANVKDYKKEYKDLYLPKTAPMLVDVGEMQFVSFHGTEKPCGHLSATFQVCRNLADVCRPWFEVSRNLADIFSIKN